MPFEQHTTHTHSGTQTDDPRNRLQDHADDAKHEYGEAKDSVRDRTRSTMNRIRESARDTNRAAREQSRRMAARARNRGEAAADRQKNRFASQADIVGDAIHSAANTLREEHDDRLAGYVDSMANGLDSAARYMRERRPNELLGEVRDFARRRPEIFIGGLFIAGAAAARFLRASREHETRPSDYETSGNLPMRSDQQHHWQHHRTSGSHHGWETRPHRERPFAQAHAEGRRPEASPTAAGASATPGRERSEKSDTAPDGRHARSDRPATGPGTPVSPLPNSGSRSFRDIGETERPETRGHSLGSSPTGSDRPDDTHGRPGSVEEGNAPSNADSGGIGKPSEKREGDALFSGTSASAPEKKDQNSGITDATRSSDDDDKSDELKI